MKWLAIPLSLFVLAACGDNNDEVTNTPENAPTEGTTENNNTANDGVTNNDMNGEGATTNNTVVNNTTNAFDFTEFSLDVDYSATQDFEVDYENEQSGVEASYEDEANNERYYGDDAYDRIEQVFQSFKFNKDTAEEEVIKEVLNAFNLPDNYQKFDLEIRFADGTEKEYHKQNQGQ